MVTREDNRTSGLLSRASTGSDTRCKISTSKAGGLAVRHNILDRSVLDLPILDLSILDLPILDLSILDFPILGLPILDHIQ